MPERSYGMTNIKIAVRGRDYILVRGKWENGSAGLLLLNSKTGAALQATVMQGPLPHGANDAHVIDEAGILQALEIAGVIKTTPQSTTIDGLKVRTCIIVHPDLIQKEHTPERKNNHRALEHEHELDR